MTFGVAGWITCTAPPIDMAMQRLMPLIAALFVLASVWGGANSYALAYSSSVPEISIADGDADFCLAPDAESDPVVSFKACGKKQSGIVLPCNGHPGLVAEPCDIQFDAVADDYATVTGEFSATPLIEERLKPPIAG